MFFLMLFQFQFFFKDKNSKFCKLLVTNQAVDKLKLIIMQCLLVDDDLDDQEVFLMTLEKINKNIKCLIANNGAEALLLLTTQNSFVPDYIFLDVNMPKMNGIECLKNIKSLTHLNNCKIFMYSTTSETSVLETSKK